jgi:hypothetical protein
VKRRTFANCDNSTPAGAMPRFMHIAEVSSGTELPAKMRVLRIAKCGVESFTRVGTSKIFAQG